MLTHALVGVSVCAVTVLVTHFSGVSKLSERVGVVETKVTDLQKRQDRIERKVDDVRVAVARLNGDGPPRPIE